jgi:hypothetical protein
MIAQIFGMTFVSIILICLVWSIMSYIFNGTDRPGKRNKKLLDNMKKIK